MNKGGILFLLLAAGYVGFELYILQQTGYRTEPLFIFDKFVTADQAAARCPGPDAGQRERFARNLQSVRRRAMREVAETNPQWAPPKVERTIAERAAQKRGEVDAMVDARGCDDSAVWELLKGFENRARLNLR